MDTGGRGRRNGGQPLLQPAPARNDEPRPRSHGTAGQPNRHDNPGRLRPRPAVHHPTGRPVPPEEDNADKLHLINNVAHGHSPRPRHIHGMGGVARHGRMLNRTANIRADSVTILRAGKQRAQRRTGNLRPAHRHTRLPGGKRTGRRRARLARHVHDSRSADGGVRRRDKQNTARHKAHIHGQLRHPDTSWACSACAEWPER